MKKSLTILIAETENARKNFIKVVNGLSYEEVTFRPSPEAWTISQIAEHMVWAERAGVFGMWKALEGVKNNAPIWEGTPIHQGLPIEEVIEKTWKTKEDVPDIADPRWGGPIPFWISSLQGCATPLAVLGRELVGHDLEKIIYPHPISGPLNVRQRMEFLRFHLERHQAQAVRTLSLTRLK